MDSKHANSERNDSAFCSVSSRAWLSAFVPLLSPMKPMKFPMRPSSASSSTNYNCDACGSDRLVAFSCKGAASTYRRIWVSTEALARNRAATRGAAALVLSSAVLTLGSSVFSIQ